MGIPASLKERYQIQSQGLKFFGDPPYFLAAGEWERIQGIIARWYEGGKTLFQEPALKFLKEEGIIPPAPLEPGAIFDTFDFQGEELSLIEVNTNGGGYIPALLALAEHAPHEAEELLARGKRLFLEMIAEEKRQLGEEEPRPVYLGDENPVQEFLYPEMCTLAQWLSPLGSQGKPWALPELLPRLSQEPLPPLLYNRYTDFYLTTPLGRGLRALWEQGKLFLSPSPIHYALQADKRLFLVATGAGFPGIPRTMTLEEWEGAYPFSQRKSWVFKPATSHGSKGVYLGRKLSYVHFQNLPRGRYLVQEYLPPLSLPHPQWGEIKGDLRVFTYKGKPLLVGFRGFRGQVMGFQEEGSGFYPVIIEGVGPALFG